MSRAMRFYKTGGPEVLVWEDVEVGKPGPGEARVRHTAVGLNYVDTYVRSGLYPAPLPSGLGTEAAGVVEEIGPGVDLGIFAQKGSLFFTRPTLNTYAARRADLLAMVKDLLEVE